MTHRLNSYLPQDRRRALARGQPLPDRTSGAALFADISGFTPLTEALRAALGPRRGAEELARQLEAVYEALIAEVERWGGSVIGFAGDSINCWFDDAHGPAAPRAAGCAFGLQAAMAAFAALRLPDGRQAALGLKVSVASGPARRLGVGDPGMHYLDTLAGATVARMAAGEHLAGPGDVVLDESTARGLSPAVQLGEWRQDPVSGERFALAKLAGGLSPPADPEPAPELAPDVLRPWVHPQVVERELAGLGEFLIEFRPCVVLFVGFSGIDYDAAGARGRLAGWVGQIQAIAGRYDGVLLELTIGDKGSYAYINLGALSAHEDDARRGAKIALGLRAAAQGLGYLEPLRMGLSQGTLRVGAFGGATRRTYAALGDEVNLAARLMAAAGPGGILVSGPVQQAVGQGFSFEPRAPLPMKGKAEPLPVFGLVGERQARAIRLQEPSYALPMVGRQAELETIEQKLELALGGQAQLVGIVAEAGLGKSRLVAEVIRSSRRRGFAGYGGACQSDAVNAPYQAWKAVWSALLDVDPAAPVKKQIRQLAGEIGELAPERAAALPLLGPVLDLDIPDNDFTRRLEPKDRKGALHALLEDCLRAAARDEPLLIVIEDLHWIDALSHDLLEELARALTGERICFVVAYRPPQLARLVAPRLESLGQFTRIELGELSARECEQAIRAKLAQLYPARAGALPPGLVERLMAHAQGNPFYLEELLNYLRDRGLDPHDPAALAHIELPESLHTLILSRIDQLSEREKTTLRAASVVGRLFQARWLVGYYPALGEYGQVAGDLDELAGLDLTPLDTPEPELAYLFKHVVTQEVAYESLPYAARARLHEQLGAYLETIAAPVETVAYHYGLSHNRAKQREYWRKAGEAAQAAYANQAALDYFAKLLLLVADPQEKIDLHLKRGDLHALIGQWAEAEAEYRAALDLAEQTRNARASVRCQLAWGRLAGSRGDYAGARQWAERALAGAKALADVTLQAQSALNCGQASLALGDYASAEAYCESSLAMARAQGDLKIATGALGTLATIANEQSHADLARSLLEESLKLGRQVGERLGAKGLAGMRQSGTSANIAGMLCSNGFIACQRQDYAQAQSHYVACLNLIWPTAYRGLDWARAWAGLARTFLEQPAALTHGVQLAALAEQILREMGAILWPIERIPLDEALASARAVLGDGAFNAVWAAGQALTLEAAIALAQEPDSAQPPG